MSAEPADLTFSGDQLPLVEHHFRSRVPFQLVTREGELVAYMGIREVIVEHDPGGLGTTVRVNLQQILVAQPKRSKDVGP